MGRGSEFGDVERDGKTEFGSVITSGDRRPSNRVQSVVTVADRRGAPERGDLAAGDIDRRG